MKVYSLKNYISLYHKYCKNNKMELRVEGLETGSYYSFEIDNEAITLRVGTDTEDFLMMKVTDVDHMFLADENFKPIFMLERKFKKDGGVFEESKKWIQYPAQMYITLFNNMDKLAHFTISHDGKKEYCTYLSGKVFIIEETEEEYIVRGSNLNHMHTLFGEYEILYVWDMYRKLSYAGFLEEQERIAKELGKQIVKYKLDVKVGG